MFSEKLETWLGYVLPPVAWMAAIFVAGSDLGSAAESRSWLDGLLAWTGLARRLDPGTLALVNVGLRKTGHFVAYALLAFLVARLFVRWSGPGARWALPAAWGVALAWAAVDELHQSFFPSRGGSAADVALDALGAAAALGVYRWVLDRNRPGG